MPRKKKKIAVKVVKKGKSKIFVWFAGNWQQNRVLNFHSSVFIDKNLRQMLK